MLMFWDALREAAARRRQHKKKSNNPSTNDCFSAKKNKRNFIQKTKKEYLQKKKKKTYHKSPNVFYLNFSTALRYGTAFSNS